MKKFYTTLIAACFTIIASAQTATFTFTYIGFTPQAQTVYEYAANIWSHTIVSSVPIKVVAHFQPLTPSTLGITFPNGVKDFIGAPHDSTWYVTALANAITGTELNPGQADLEMYLNSTISWYFDTTGTVPAGQFDFASIALHELCHGLGFLSVAKKTGTTGSFGLITASDFAPLTTSFPWPQLDTLPAVFDRFLVNDLDEQLDTFANPSTGLGAQFTGNQVYFNGAYSMAANGGNKPRIYAPSIFSLGSSITHLDEATYPAGNPNELMTPIANPVNAPHTPGPICIGILKDIGWNINPAGISEIAARENGFRVYPNPSSDYIFISTFFPKEKIKSIEVKNLLGEKVLTSENISGIDVGELPKGIYFIIVSTIDFEAQQKFIKE